MFLGADQEWVVVGGREFFDGDQQRAEVHDEFALDLANIVPGLGEVGHQNLKAWIAQIIILYEYRQAVL